MLPPWTIPVMLFLLAALIVAGVGRLVMERQYSIAVYILFFCVAICGTPWPDQFSRYLSTVAPFLSLSLILSVRGVVALLSRLLPAQTRLIGVTAMAAVALLVLGCYTATMLFLFNQGDHKVTFFQNGQKVHYRLIFYEDGDRALDAGLDWLKTRAHDNEVLAATMPQWAYLRTGLKTVMPPFELDPERAQRQLDTVPVSYLIVDESKYKKYTARVVAAYPDRWQRVYADAINEDGKPGRFEIYERIGLMRPPGRS
jgi:hypothetical protein